MSIQNVHMQYITSTDVLPSKNQALCEYTLYVSENIADTLFPF